MSSTREGTDVSCHCRCFSSKSSDFHCKSDTKSENQNCSYCSEPEHSCSCSILSCNLSSEKDSEKLWRIIMASIKGFTIGAGLKGGLAVFSTIAKLRRGKLSASARKARLISNGEAVVMAAKETIRYGLFLGTFAGTFTSVDECISALGGHHRTASWRALFAGAIAGPSMLLTGPNTQHTSLAIYILMRAAVLASRCGIKSKRFGGMCKPLTWAHGDIFLMCLSSSQILSSYILSQDSLPPSYKSFLNKHGGKDSVILQGVKEILSGMPFTNLEGIEKHYKSMGANVKLDPEMKVPCSIVHGNQPCATHAVSFLVRAYGRAVLVYLPIYLIPALIVHRQDLLKWSFTILGKGLLGTARSSLFLSVYCSSAWSASIIPLPYAESHSCIDLLTLIY